MASVRWIGAADDVKQISTVTAGGTWATGDLVTVICNNKTVTVTLGSDVATTDVVDLMRLAINASTATESTRGDETRNTGGQSYGEFNDMVATVDDGSSILTLTSSEGGIDFTITVSKTSTSGTWTLNANTTEATGRNWFNNAANWLGGSLPSNDDTIVYDSGNISCDNGLNVTSSITGLILHRDNTYFGDIGREPVNKRWGDALQYSEYRTQKLDVRTAASKTVLHRIGDQHSEVTPSGKTYLNLFTTQGTFTGVQVYASAPRSPETGSTVKIVGGAPASFTVFNGSLQIGDQASDPATSTTTITTDGPEADLRVTRHVAPAGNATITCGDGVIVWNATDSNAPIVTVRGGKLLYQPFSGSTPTSVDVKGGEFHNFVGTITTLTLWDGGKFINGGGLIITNATFYSGFHYDDSVELINTITNGIDFSGCGPEDGVFKTVRNLTWTPSAI